MYPAYFRKLRKTGKIYDVLIDENENDLEKFAYLSGIAT